MNKYIVVTGAAGFIGSCMVGKLNNKGIKDLVLVDEIEYLSQKPDSGFDFSSVRKGYYRSRIKSHFIFYRIDQKNDIVEIIRILHQRMDIENRLSE